MSALFQPITLGGIELPNRIVIAPMCQYSANDGSMNDWHLAHYGSLAQSRAGLLVFEATHVSDIARITHGCAGLYSDANEAAMKRVVELCRNISPIPLGVQIAHAGRKASTERPWEGRGPLKPGQGDWQTVSASALPAGEGWHSPRELTGADLRDIRDQFVAATERALRIGFDLVELHGAHGYLMHQFLSPISNRRTDGYGGDAEGRMRFPLEIAAAMREVWPKDKALGARITGSDWLEDGLAPEDAVTFAGRLKALGYDFVCVSSGGIGGITKFQVTPGYQVPFARGVKQGTGIATRAVGMIVDPHHAERIVADGDADMVALARGFLDNPRWVWHAAEALGAKLDLPPQYERAGHELWTGAGIARPAARAAE
jgi:2,4-dienoyl-CoA reductase-like NADH-dependent reductase (Old Yellow Enzyme family)